jgi:hypothetical protein
VSTELKDVLSVCGKIRGNNREFVAHYLLGYLWAGVPEERRAEILETFKSEAVDE